MLKFIPFFFLFGFPAFLFFSKKNPLCSNEFHIHLSPSLRSSFFMHSVVSVSSGGDCIEIEDGSLWTVCRYDGAKALCVKQGDLLTLTQNCRWFSSYRYRMVHQSTGICLEVDLLRAPLEGGVYTLHITQIGQKTGDFSMTNGEGEMTQWQVFSEDLAIFQNWTLGDAVILGQNSGGEGRYEAFLIHAKEKGCVRARRRE